jgi:hypothetical protein
MDRKEAIKVLVSILREYQDNIGEEVDELNESTRPIGDLRSFDSLTGVMATVHCYEKFHIESDIKGISLFVGKNQRGLPCALTVGEIADRIITLTSKG